MAKMPKGQQTRYRIPSYDVITLRGTESASGSEAQFFRLAPSSKYGIKMYKTIEEAEEAYECQKLAAEYSLAPNVGHKLFIRYFPNSKTKIPRARFGYETKIAKPVKGGYGSKEWREQSYELESALCQLGLGCDFHIKNAGLIAGKLVAVDFGKTSQGNFG